MMPEGKNPLQMKSFPFKTAFSYYLLWSKIDVYTSAIYIPVMFQNENEAHFLWIIFLFSRTTDSMFEEQN